MSASKNILEGRWNELKGQGLQKWGKLTDNDWTEIKGNRDELLGRLQKNYGYAQAQAEKEVADWEKSTAA